jgi:uncharacterized membrane protein
MHTQALERTAKGLLLTHAAMLTFATLAMVTILAGSFPVLMSGPYTDEAFAFGWKWSGQLTVLTGAAATLALTSSRFGARRALLLFVAAVSIALSSELAGTITDLPFGPYDYTQMLGYRIGGEVPYPIPISWYYMLFASLAITARIARVDDTSGTKWRWALIAGAVLTAWDVPMEVHMTVVQPAHWVWRLETLPAWVPDWLGGPLFYGMPLTNWIGWYLTGVVISRVMLAIVPPTMWRSATAALAFPLVLYAANGLMPILTTARHGLWLAAVLGTLVMGWPLWLAYRGRQQTSAS